MGSWRVLIETPLDWIIQETKLDLLLGFRSFKSSDMEGWQEVFSCNISLDWLATCNLANRVLSLLRSKILCLSLALTTVLFLLINERLFLFMSAWIDTCLIIKGSSMDASNWLFPLSSAVITELGFSSIRTILLLLIVVNWSSWKGLPCL